MSFAAPLGEFKTLRILRKLVRVGIGELEVPARAHQGARREDKFLAVRLVELAAADHAGQPVREHLAVAQDLVGRAFQEDVAQPWDQGLRSPARSLEASPPARHQASPCFRSQAGRSRHFRSNAPRPCPSGRKYGARPQ